MAARCFEPLHKNVKSSSDYTRNRQLKQKWCDLNRIDPFTTNTNYAIGIQTNGDALILTAPSQSEQLEIVKAKYAGNPSLIGADTCINNVQAGNLITYDETTKTRKLNFNSQPQFWRCANSDPHHGFKYPATVNTSYQEPNETKNIPQTKDGSNVLVSFLYGGDKLR